MKFKPSIALMQYHLKNIAIPAKIGVYESEKLATQTLVINVWFEHDSTQASCTDDLQDTIDYAQIESLLREICLSDHFALLEKLHAVIKQAINQNFPYLERLEIAIEKAPFESGSIVLRL